MSALKQVRFLKKVMTGIFIFLVIFIQEILILSLLDKTVPDALIVSVFGFCGLEAGIGGWVKHLESKTGGKNDV